MVKGPKLTGEVSLSRGRCVGGGVLELVCLAGVTDCLTFAGLFIENVLFFFPIAWRWMGEGMGDRMSWYVYNK